MLGAIVGDLAAWTYENDKESFNPITHFSMYYLLVQSKVSIFAR